MNTINVLDHSHTFDIAKTIASTIRENQRAEIEAVGEQAIQRAVKALSVATEYLRAEDIVLTYDPQVSNIWIGDRETNAVNIVVGRDASQELVTLDR